MSYFGRMVVLIRFNVVVFVLYCNF